MGRIKLPSNKLIVRQSSRMDTVWLLAVRETFSKDFHTVTKFTLEMFLKYHEFDGRADYGNASTRMRINDYRWNSKHIFNRFDR